VAIEDRTLNAAAAVTMNRTFSAAVDWALVAVEIRPGGTSPRGAVKSGYAIDGAMPEEMRRGCTFCFPPCQTTYPWGGLEGALVQAMLLSRQGYDVWNWQDQALCAVNYLFFLDQQYGGWWASGDDTYVPWLVNFVYGTHFPTSPAAIGKNMGWSHWIYGR